MQKILAQWIITIRKTERSRGQKNGEVMRTEKRRGQEDRRMEWRSVDPEEKRRYRSCPELFGVVDRNNARHLFLLSGPTDESGVLVGVLGGTRPRKLSK